MAETSKPERISKAIAAAGLCSRRDAERWIAAGRVVLNGKTLNTPAVTVTAEDVVIVDGKQISGKVPTRLWLYHKPAGLVTTHSDPEGRSTVFERLPEELPRVISIGRLDLNSEGLLLLTTSGTLSRHLEHPSTGWKRKYRVRVFGHPTEAHLTQLKRGITVDGVHYRSIVAHIEQTTKNHCWLNMTLSEGKNREIRTIFEHLGMPVTRLIRVAYGPFQLGKLTGGEVKEVQKSVMRTQLGKQFL